MKYFSRFQINSSSIRIDSPNETVNVHRSENNITGSKAKLPNRRYKKLKWINVARKRQSKVGIKIHELG